MTEFQNNDLTLKDIIFKIKDTWKYLLPKWKIISLFVLIGSSIGLYKSFTTKPKFEAKLQLILQEESSSGGGISSLASSFGFGGNTSGLFSTPNMLEYFKTRKLIEKALLNKINFGKRKVTFADYYIYKNGWLNDWKEDNSLKNIKFSDKKMSRIHDSIIGLIYDNLSKTEYRVEQPDDKNGVILLELKTVDERFSKNFLEELVKVVSENYIQSKIKKQYQTVHILEHQVDSVRNELHSSLIGVASSNDQIVGLNPSMNVKRVPSVKKQIDVQANTKILEELVKNLELSKMNLLNQTPLIEIIDKPVFPLEKKRLGKLKGIVIGGFFGGFMIVLFLLFRRYLKSIKE